MSDYISLNDALAQLASRLSLSVDDLKAYAYEDQYGGRDTGDFSAMTIHRVEGQLLYALVRALKPETVLEIGTADGGSATHILAALAANQSGQLLSYDLIEGSGGNIPATLRDRWTFVQEDVITAELPSADFIFEDSAHTLDFSILLFEKLKALQPRLLLTHDYYTDEVYANFAVRQAFEQVFDGEAFGMKLNDAFTGIGAWVNPEWEITARINDALEHHDSLAGARALQERTAVRKPRTPAAKKPTPAKRTAKR